MWLKIASQLMHSWGRLISESGFFLYFVLLFLNHLFLKARRLVFTLTKNHYDICNINGRIIAIYYIYGLYNRGAYRDDHTSRLSHLRTFSSHLTVIFGKIFLSSASHLTPKFCKVSFPHSLQHSFTTWFPKDQYAPITGNKHQLLLKIYSADRQIIMYSFII